MNYKERVYIFSQDDEKARNAVRFYANKPKFDQYYYYKGESLEGDILYITFPLSNKGMWHSQRPTRILVDDTISKEDLDEIREFGFPRYILPADFEEIYPVSHKAWSDEIKVRLEKQNNLLKIIRLNRDLS